MKKHFLYAKILSFLVVLAFFVVFPLISVFNSGLNSEAFSSWSFPYSSLVNFLFSLCVYLYSKAFLKKEVSIEKYYFFYKILFPFVFTFSVLFAFSLLFTGLSKIFTTDSVMYFSKPESFLQWIFCILNFFLSAFTEEVIFRFYFPEILLYFCSLKSSNRYLKAGIEIICALIFAVLHLPYGILSFLNSFICHFVLRLNYKKNSNLYSNVSSHFLYNIISLILL